MLDSRQLPDWQGRPCKALGHALFREWLLVYEIIVECIWVLSGGASRLHKMHLKGGTQLTSTFTLTREPCPGAGIFNSIDRDQHV
ncbi:hypothetical protein BMJ23_19720 [Sinorhizobium medicae]|nr:hypothetical protein BMJ23_19720 [Sinorhizobium medicae]